MPDYQAIVKVKAGKVYAPGEIIADGVLSDRDIASLLSFGSIAEVGADVPKVEKEVKPTPPVVSVDADNILDFINSADQAGLERIKGVGAATAKAMLNHGKFESMEKLAELVPNVNWTEAKID